MSDTNSYTLITGSSSGIGRAAAIRLSQEHRLILNGRDLHRLEETKAACCNQDHHVVWQYDLRDTEHLAQSLTQFIESTNTPVDCLIYCAGTVVILPIRAIDYQVVQEVMNVNFTSAAEIVSVLVKKRINSLHLKNILFISSIWSEFGARGYSMYCASKGALDALMRALAVELAPNVRVNSILPGAVSTRMSEQAFSNPEIVAKLKQDYPLGIGETEDIVNAIEFIISEKARWVTGQQIVVDGGRTAYISLK